MARLVRGADGRQWSLHRRMTWFDPATPNEDFDYDMTGGMRAVGVLVLLLVLMLVVVLVAWRPADVIVPSWLIAIFVIVAAFFPIRWILRRPWTLVAETDEDPIDERPPEHWVGTVHGAYRSRQQLARAAREIEDDSFPHVEGPMHPVD